MPAVPQIRTLTYNDEEIGMGFNSQSGQAVGTALEGFNIGDNPVAPGQTGTGEVSIINTHEELQQKLGMSFEADGRYGLSSGSLKAQFSESTNYNSTSTFLIVKFVIRNALRRGNGFRVTEEAQDLLDSNRFDEFQRAFGDSFVRGLYTGGEFYAVIRITSVSTSKQSELAVELQAEANGLVAGVGFKADFEESNRSDSTRSEYTATMYQKAGAGPQIAPTATIEEVLARYKEFPQIALTSAAAYGTEVATYDTLPLPVPTLEEREDFLFALSDARNKKLHWIETRNDLEFALRNPQFFDGLPPSETLTGAISAYTQLINAVMAHAIKLARGELTPPQIFDPGTLAPPLTEPAPIALQRLQIIGPAPVPAAPPAPPPAPAEPAPAPATETVPFGPFSVSRPGH